MPSFASLSDREREILRLAASGDGNRQIAARLGISPNTVKKHLSNIFTKTGVASRTEAALLAVREGLVETMPPTTSPSELPAVGRSPLLVWILLGLIVLFLVGLGIWAVLDFTRPAAQQVATTTESRWQELAPLPDGRACLAAVSYENDILVFGGASDAGESTDVLRYAASADAWDVYAPMPNPVKAATAAVLGELVYIPGGLRPDGGFSASLQVFDPRSRAWTTQASLPLPLAAYALAVYEGRLYLFGGENDAGLQDGVLVFDPAKDAWSLQAALPSPRSHASAVPLEGKILLAGGLAADGSHLSDVLAFHPARAEWEALAPLPVGVAKAGGAALAGTVYLVGGEGEGAGLAVQYLAGEDAWYGLEIPPEAVGACPVALAVGTRLHVLGGALPGGFSPSHLAYQAVYTLLLPLVGQ